MSKRGAPVMRPPPGPESEAGRNQPFCLDLGRPAAGCDLNIQPAVNETEPCLPAFISPAALQVRMNSCWLHFFLNEKVVHFHIKGSKKKG